MLKLGWKAVGGKRRDVYQGIIRDFEAGASEAGKEPSRMPRLVEVGVAYTDDHDAAIESRLRYWAGTSVPAMFNQKIYTPAMSAENGEVVGRDTIERMVLMSANPEDHVQLAQRYVDLGFTHLIYHCAGPDQRGFIEDYGRDVLPRIRERLMQAEPVPV